MANLKDKKHNKVKKLVQGDKLKKYKSIADKLINQHETNEKLKGYDLDKGFLDNF